MDFPPSVIPRGTLHCVFSSVSIAACRRLGVTSEEETELRRSLPNLSGLLVVKSVIKKSPAAGTTPNSNQNLREGDVLLKVNDRYLNHFLELEDLLDSTVGSTIKLTLKRGPAVTIERELEVEDAHKHTPNEFIEFSSGILSPISLSRARYCRLAFDDGVYVDWHGYALGNAGILAGSVITRVEDVDIRTLDDFERALVRFSRPDSPLRVVAVRFFHVNSPYRDRHSLLSLDSQWFSLRRATRNLARYSQWTYKDIPVSSAAVSDDEEDQEAQSKSLPPAMSPRSVSFRHLSSLVPANVDDRFQPSLRALCHVHFQTPIYVNGTALGMSNGAGFIVDSRLGLVVASRATVISLLGDVSVSIASFRRPAKMIFLHP